MKTFEQSFFDIENLTSRELKPLTAMLGKLMEEVGETAECVNIHEGYITHKTMKEPLVGEIADVIQVALSILVKSTPGMKSKDRRELFLSYLERKNAKWAQVQEGEHAKRDAADEQDFAETGEAPSPQVVSHMFLDPVNQDAQDKAFDPAADYTDRTGRYLSLDERMQERSRFTQQHGGLHEEF